jgi:NADPH-dependent ferric siderophore reductase
MHGEVLRTAHLSPSMVRVVLGGPGLADFRPSSEADSYVNLAFPPAGAAYGPVFDPDEVKETLAKDWWPARRRLTVRHWDAEARELTLDFVAHGDVGVAGAWALRARPGDALVMTGPSSGYHPDPTADWHLLVGDESALPATAVEAATFPEGRVHAFVHGEADEIRAIRRHLLTERGLARGQMSCSPYWRRTMTDEDWRAVKRDFIASMEGDA